MDDDRRETQRLRRRIAGLEKTLQIVTGHSGRIEKNLRQLFDIISDIMPVPMVITLRGGGVLFSNAKAQEIFGYSEPDFRNARASDIYGDERCRHAFLEIHDSEDEVADFEVLLKKADGSIFPASLFSRRIVFEEQHCMLTVIYDLSEIRKEEERRLSLERQLRQIRKMEAVGTMASGIAHEFNNILGVVFGKLQVAKRRLPEGHTSGKNLDDALDAAKRASAIVRQILDFCRQKEREEKPFPIADAVREAVKMIAPIIHPNIAVRLRMRSETAVIMGDPTHIHQVLMNLCANSNHAIGEGGGTIDIILENADPDTAYGSRAKPASYVRLTVGDDGPGVDKNIIHRVFDPFFTTKSPGQGTGMGLAVVHGIVQSHDGFVTVESEPGKGAAFHCYFPVIAGKEDSSQGVHPDGR